MIFVFQKVMRAEPKILQAKLAEILARNCKWIEIVLFQVPTEFASSFLVFPPEKTRRQKERRHNDGCDYIDTKLALQRFNHRTNISFATVATGLRPVSPSKVTFLGGRPTGPWLQRVPDGNFASAITDFQSDSTD